VHERCTGLADVKPVFMDGASLGGIAGVLAKARWTGDDTLDVLVQA